MPETWDSEDADELELRALARVPHVDPEQFMERLQPARLAPGTRIDDAFVIEHLIAQGGMGVVYLARHELLERPVALKLCRRRATPAQTERLLKEARAMAALSHPNVVAVHHVGMFDAQVYIAMEYVEGGTLRAWCAQRVRTIDEILDAFVAAGRGLEAAHARGFVHRDFKPDNVLVGSDGRVRVGDFGLVAQEQGLPTDGGESGSSSGTQSGAGTAHYMAPEQRARRPVTSAADQYAFCRSLQELLEETQRRSASGGGPSQRIPRRVELALRRGLQPDPAARYPSLGELLHALQPPRSRWSLAAIVLLAAVGVTSAVTWLASAPGARACPSAGERMIAVWGSEDQRARWRSSVGSADTHRLLEQQLDRFANDWETAFEQTCSETALPTEALALESRACLDEALAYFDETLRVLTSPAERGEPSPLEVLYALPVPQRCLDVAWLQRRIETPRSSGEAAVLAALRTELARIRAASTVDVTHPDIPRIDAAISTARALGDRSSLAVALLVRARIGAEADEGPHHTVARFEEAFLEAEAAGDDRLRAEIGAQIVYFIGVAAGKPTEALAWATRTRAVLTRLGDAGTAELGSLEDSIARVHLAAGQDAEAKQALERAVSLKERALGRDHPSTATTRLALGRLWMRTGAHERAREVLEAAGEGYRNALGPRNPGGAHVELALAELAEEQGEDGEALARFGGVLAQWEAEFGLDHPRLILVLNDLGRVHSRVGQHDEALESYGRARTIAERALGPDHVDTGWAVLNEADGQLAAGDHARALEGFSRAVEIMQAQPGPLDGLDNDARVGRAEAQLVGARAREAIDEARIVLDSCAARPCRPGLVARAGFVEARGLAAEGDHALAEQRLARVLAELPEDRRTHRRLRDLIQRWLDDPSQSRRAARE